MEIFLPLKKAASMLWQGKLTTAGIIEELYNTESDVTRKVGHALQKYRMANFTSEEQAHCNAIEQLRSKFRKENTLISILDYGAGGSNGGMVRHERISSLCRSSAKSKRWCMFLFALVREVKPSVIVELGTNMGISGAYLTAACELNGSGKVYTLEGSPSLVQRARHTFRMLGLSRVEVLEGMFQKTLPELLEKEKNNISFVFLDGHHRKAATLRYVQQIMPSLTDEAVLVFDDICWSEEMADAWLTLRSEKNVRFSLDLFEMGLCCIKKGAHKQHHRSALWI